jgi:hypothetical protein
MKKYDPILIITRRYEDGSVRRISESPSPVGTSETIEFIRMAMQAMGYHCPPIEFVDEEEES